MRYLERYKVFENLQKAKSVLKKNDIEESHPAFETLKELLKNNMGYIGWFVDMLFNKGVELNDLISLYNDSIVGRDDLIKALPKSLISYTDWEKLMDDLMMANNNLGINRMINELPSLQKSFISPEIKPFLLKLSKMSDKDNLLKKISRYKTKEELLTAIKLFTTDKRSIGYTNIKKLIIESGAEIICDSHFDNIIICDVNFTQLKKLASNTSWCILNQSTFNSYVSGIDNQYIIFLTDKKDNYSKIGVTFGLAYKTAHLVNDEYISLQKLSKLMDDRDVSINILKIDIEEFKNNKDKINKVSVEELIKYGFSTDEIFPHKTIYSERDVRYVSKNVSEKDYHKYELKDLVNKLELFQRDINWRTTDAAFIIKNKDRINFKLGFQHVISSMGCSIEEIEKLKENGLLEPEFLIITSNISNLRGDKKYKKLLAYIKGYDKKDTLSMDMLLFMFKYGNVSSKDYDLSDVIDIIPTNFRSPVKELITYLEESGFVFDEETAMKLALKLSA